MNDKPLTDQQAIKLIRDIIADELEATVNSQQSPALLVHANSQPESVGDVTTLSPNDDLVTVRLKSPPKPGITFDIRVAIAVIGFVLFLGSTAFAWYATVQRKKIEQYSKAELLSKTFLDMAEAVLSDFESAKNERVLELLAKARAQRADIPPGETAALFDRRLRSILARLQSVLDLTPPGSEYENWLPLPDFYWAPWPVAIHPTDSKLLAVGLADRAITWKRGTKPNSAIEVELSKRNRQIPVLRFHPQGDFLFFGRNDGALIVYDRDASRLVDVLVEPSEQPVLALGFGPMNSSVFAYRQDGTLFTWDMPAKSNEPFPKPVKRLLKPDAIQPSAAAFNGDASQLAIGDVSGQTLVASTKLVGDNRTTRMSSSNRSSIQSLTFSPKGAQLAAGAKDGTLALWTVDGQSLRSWTPFNNGVNRIVFSPDGNFIFAGVFGVGMKVYNTTSDNVLLSGPFVPFEFAGDGETIVGGRSDRVTFAQMRFPATFAVLNGHRSGIARLAWAANGKYFATLDMGFTVSVWNAETRERIAIITDLPFESAFYAVNGAICLSNDGRYLGFASGGENESHVVIVEVAAPHRVVAKWKLDKGGFEYLVHLGDKRFRLVREELQGRGSDVNTFSTVYELVVPEQSQGDKDLPLPKGRVIRSARKGDVNKYLSAFLSADGGVYAWYGPRDPSNAQRTEVYRVDTGELVKSWPPDPTPPGFLRGPIGGLLSPSGRKLWVEWLLRGDKGNTIAEHRLIDLSKSRPAQTVTQSPSAVSYDERSLAYPLEPNAEEGRISHAISWWYDGKPIVELSIGPAQTGAAEACQFDPTGKYLACGTADGKILLVELARLQKSIDADLATLRK